MTCDGWLVDGPMLERQPSYRLLVGAPRALDRQDRARNRSSVVRGEEYAERGDLSHGHELLGRLGRKKHVLDHLLLTDAARLGHLRNLLLDQRREYISGAYRIDGDASLGDLKGPRLGQSRHAVLCRSIGRHGRGGDESLGGSKIDD